MTTSLLRHGVATALAVAGLVTAGLTAAPAQAGHGHDHDHGRCRSVHAVGVGTDDGAGTTTATIYRGRRVIGTTVGTFTPGTPTGSVVPFTGTIVFTNTHGTLVAPVDGTLDVATGDFASASDTVTGTGAYAAVTGRLDFRGVEDLTTLAFTEVVHGRLCVPRHRTP